VKRFSGGAVFVYARQRSDVLTQEWRAAETAAPFD
jgi:hypothetical protein